MEQEKNQTPMKPKLNQRKRMSNFQKILFVMIAALILLGVIIVVGYFLTKNRDLLRSSPAYFTVEESLWSAWPDNPSKSTTEKSYPIKVGDIIKARQVGEFDYYAFEIEEINKDNVVFSTYIKGSMNKKDCIKYSSLSASSKKKSYRLNIGEVVEFSSCTVDAGEDIKVWFGYKE